VVIHLRNHAHLFMNYFVLVALIGEHQNSGKKSDQHVIDCRSHAGDAPAIQQRSEADAKDKDPAAQAKTVYGAPRESEMFPVHRPANYFTMV